MQILLDTAKYLTYT